MALKKPSDLFYKKTEENDFPVVEFDTTLRDELVKIESLSEQVFQLQQELSQKVVQTDLEKLVLSQINSMQENFEYLQNDFRKSNKKDIVEFKDKVTELTNVVENILEVEFPKYKKQITKSQFNIGEKFDEFKGVVEENILSIKENVDTQVNNIVEVIDNNLEYFNNQLRETSSEVKKTTETYNNLSKIVESKVSKENEKLEEYSQVIQSLYESFVELETSLKEESSSHLQVIGEKFETISSDVANKIYNIGEEVESFKDEIVHQISGIKADVVIFEKHNQDTQKNIEDFTEQLSKIVEIDKSLTKISENIDELETRYKGVSNESVEIRKDLSFVETYIQKYNKEFNELKEDVFEEIEKLPIGDVQKNIANIENKIQNIQEIYSKINPEIIVKELKDEIASVKNSIPEVKSYDEDVEYLYQKLSSIKIPDQEKYLSQIKTIYETFEEKNYKLLEKVKYLEEVFKNFNEKTLTEGLLNILPDDKNTDPLTPLNQNFVTLDQLQEHYRLFINRIQQQLATFGGGGETRLKYLDDIVGIATNSSAYDGKYLKYNHSLGKFEFSSVDNSNDSWQEGAEGPYTNGNVGIGTSIPILNLDIIGSTYISGSLGVGITNPDTALHINGNGTFEGNVIASGTVTANSDEKIKTNVKTISNALDKVISLRGVEYDRTDTQDHQIGVIAQEVEKIVPEVVYGDELKSVAYGNLIGLLIEAIKEQNEEIQSLKKLLNDKKD